MPGTEVATIPETGLPVEYDETHLTIQGEISYEEWEGLGSALGSMNRCSRWWIGDWINYGEHAYGEKYSQALEVTGLAVQTLLNYAWVSGAIPPSQRRPDVSWQHHLLVAGKEVDANRRRSLLAKVADEELTTRDLKDILVDEGLVKERVPRVRYGEAEVCNQCGRTVKVACEPRP